MKFKFENLDSIRSIAFFSTFLAHAFYTESEEVLKGSAYQLAIHFREVFSFGVPIFFVLSGFLITFLMLKEQENNHHFSIKNFYIRRILRIWPVYFLVLFIGFVAFPLFRNLFLHQPYIETANPWMYLFFLSNFDQIVQNTLPYGVGLGPTWSVSIEEQFYFVWPILFVLFKGRKFMIPITLIIISSLLFISICGVSNKNTLFCMLYLAVGGLSAYLSFYHNSLILKITRIQGVFFILLTILLFGSIYFNTTGPSYTFLFLFIALLIAYLIIYQCYSGKCELKTIPLLENLGKYTYGLYLYHVIFNFVTHLAIDDILMIPETNWSVLLIKPLISLSLSIIFSILSYRYFENYFLKIKAQYSRNEK